MTWSIIARDPASGALGIAIATRFFAVGALCPHAESGVGALSTQALMNPHYGPQGLDLLRKRGVFVEYSVFKDPVTVDWSIISDDKELDVLGAHLGPHCWPAAVSMIESGRLPMDRICTHQLPVSEFQEGLELVEDGGSSIKVTLIPE